MRRDVFQAIADPTRRAILGMIALQAMTPNLLAEEFATSRQAISKHIRILAECRLITPEPNGREILYTLNPEQMKAVDDWISPFRKLWEERYNRLDQVLKNLKSE